jgi:hypothetical protein
MVVFVFKSIVIIILHDGAYTVLGRGIKKLKMKEAIRYLKQQSHIFYISLGSHELHAYCPHS